MYTIAKEFGTLETFVVRRYLCCTSICTLQWRKPHEKTEEYTVMMMDTDHKSLTYITYTVQKSFIILLTIIKYILVAKLSVESGTGSKY